MALAGCAETFARYRAHAPELRAAWHTISLEDWLRPVAPYLSARKVLDVGAGTGRLATHLASRGAQVTAVEPVAELWAAPGIRRVDDSLPALRRTRGTYDLVLCLGVLHHLAPRDQQRAFHRLAHLTSPGGRVILALRHGRDAWPVRAAALCAPCLKRHILYRRPAIQPGNVAKGVRFAWLVFRKSGVH